MAHRPDYSTPPVDYSTPSPSARRGHNAWFIVPLIRGLAFAAVVHLLLAVVTPAFGTVLKDFKLDLPTSTRVLLSASRAYTQNFGWAFLAPLACVPLLVAALTRDRRGRMATAAYYALMFVLVLWVVSAIFMPYVSLISGISSANGKK